jgi:hypothetical protein
MRKFYMADADMKTDIENNKLRVFLHRTNHWTEDSILENLCDILNQTQTVFPNTNLTMAFDLLSS